MRSRDSIVLATRSEGKRRELLPHFARVGVELETLAGLGLPERPEEESLEAFDTFEANALAKARWFRSLLPDRIVIGDDSGLSVDALYGAPGVHSKRWAGAGALTGRALDDANNAALQRAMADAAREGRRTRAARYVCAASCVWANGALVRLGETHGTIIETPRGDQGFGYDPYFLSDDLRRTFAEVTSEEKSAVSHRGRAFDALIDAMRNAGILPVPS